MQVRESNPVGCDAWLGGRYCEADAPHVDEVDDRRYCAEHAGPLAWSARLVNLYSAALRIGAYTDMPVKVPTESELRHSSSAGDAKVPGMGVNEVAA